MIQQPAPARPASDRRWAMSRWWWLVFLVNLVFEPAFDPGSGIGDWAVTALAAVAFVAFYLRVTLHGGWLGRWSPHVATVLALVVFPLNVGATVFLIYAASFAAGVAPRRGAYAWFAGLSALTLSLAAFVPLAWPIALAVFGFPALLVWIVGLACLEERDRDTATTQLRIDNARIGHLATASERERIARDLHDVLGQSLTEVIVRTQLARRLLATDPARAEAELAEIERSSRRSLDEVRSAVRGWREVRIDDELDVAVRGLEAAGVAVAVDRDEGFDPPPTTETALALALREAVTNVVRHAAASRCSITLRRQDGHDVLTVADDGRGGSAREGTGLTGMRERVAALGGDVERRTEAGTTVTVRLPAGVPA